MSRLHSLWVLPALCTLFAVPGHAQVLPNQLDGKTLTKYVDALPVPGEMPYFWRYKRRSGKTVTWYKIGAYPIAQKLHRDLNPTKLWGYGTSKKTASFPAATIEARKGHMVKVLWTNNLVNRWGRPIRHPLPVDRSLHWADPLGQGRMVTNLPYTGPVPLVTHVHGAEVEVNSDGGPEAWFTPWFRRRGPTFAFPINTYHNDQPATTLWYHDHALGITRLNVYMGLAGFWLLRDDKDTIASKLPAPSPRLNDPAGTKYYEIPIVIQDRLLTKKHQLLYPNMSINPEHPQWGPEMFGDVILVNGKAWPFLNVEPRKYRFRVLNGSNARFYAMKLEGVNATTGLPNGTNGPAIQQIGGDGGYLPAPAVFNGTRVVIGPGERQDIIVDFRGLTAGTEFILTNTGNAPYPDGDPVDPLTNGQLMKFRVVAGAADNLTIPGTLNTIPKLTPTFTRTLTLNEKMGAGGPLEMYVNGQHWGPNPFTDAEIAKLGRTEDWEIVNLTADTHPIHTHLVQFQLINREDVDVARYEMAWMVANKNGLPLPLSLPTVSVPLAGYLVPNSQSLPLANETGWKDTIHMHPGQVTRIRIRFSPTDGSPRYPFDPTAGKKGATYVWHCHILEHEDNEMMRRLRIVK